MGFRVYGLGFKASGFRVFRVWGFQTISRRSLNPRYPAEGVLDEALDSLSDLLEDMHDANGSSWYEDKVYMRVV